MGSITKEEQMAKQVLLKIDDENTKLIETDFSQDELEDCASKIREGLEDTDDGWNEDKIIEELEKKGYLKVIGPGPQIYDMMFI